MSDITKPQQGQQFFAHSRAGRPVDEWEELGGHLLEVARLAKIYAKVFGAGDFGRVAGNFACVAGLWHDLGKATYNYTTYFTRGKHPGIRDHSTYGAKFAKKNLEPETALIVAHCIAAHHSGLLDEHRCVESPANGLTLMERFEKKVDKSNWQVWANRRVLRAHKPLTLPTFYKPYSFSTAFFTRMIFSCLVDADHKATAGFYKGTLPVVQEGPSFDPDYLLRRLADYLAKMINSAAPEVEEVRAITRQKCIEAADLDRGFLSLTSPTGGGKTLSSAEFSLRHAKKHGQRRIIYAVPYISITTQIADIFRKVFGADMVLEHHSNVVQKENEEESSDDKFPPVSENWDSPIVVTTAVQLFESLFAYKTGRCRKLHNIANSVIVLDEAQMLPVRLLEPCLAALKELVANYNCSVVLCTATQPAIDHDPVKFPIGLENVREIIPERVLLFQKLNRVTFHDVGYVDKPMLLGHLSGHESFLCIVSTRAQAAEFYYDLQALRPGADDLFHLSTFKCGKHRAQTLEEINRRLKEKLPCRVISTSLIEAGVDIDFPVVFRAYAGVDSIAQAAGRCNRHGNLGDGGGHVYIFDLNGSHALRGEPMEAVRVTKELLRIHGCDELLSVGMVKDYFDRFYRLNGDRVDRFGIMHKMEHRYFRTIGLTFKMVDEDHQVLFPYSSGPGDDEGERLVEQFQKSPSMKLLRRLQPYSIPVYGHHFMEMVGSGQIIICGDDNSRIAVLNKQSGLYCSQIGLKPKD